MTKHQTPNTKYQLKSFVVAFFSKREDAKLPSSLNKKKRQQKTSADICCLVISFYFNEKDKYSKFFKAPDHLSLLL